MTGKDGKTAVIQQNRYNGDGQRIQKVEGSKTTNYYYQDGVVSYTTDGENSQTSQNLIGTDGNILQHRDMEVTIRTICCIIKISREVAQVL